MNGITRRKIDAILLIAVLWLTGCSAVAVNPPENLDSIVSQMQAETVGKSCFYLNGTVYQLPVNYERFAEGGWTDKDAAINQPKVDVFSKENVAQSFLLTDDQGAKIPFVYSTSRLSNTVQVSNIYLDRQELKNETVVFAKGITFASSYSEIIGAYGEPDFIETDLAGVSFVYHEGEGDVWGLSWFRIQLDDQMTIRAVSMRAVFAAFVPEGESISFMGNDSSSG